MRRAAIVNPLRTPIGAFGRSLHGVPVEPLGAVVARAVVEGAGRWPGHRHHLLTHLTGGTPSLLSSPFPPPNRLSRAES
jgi:acetyl-CoA C-acetyltransferase